MSLPTKIDIDKQNRIESPEITHLPAINLRQKRQEYTMEKRQSLQQAVLGKLDSYIINEVRTHPLSIHKNKLEMLKDLNIRHDVTKLLEKNTGKHSWT